jgi:hypothetical protein
VSLLEVLKPRQSQAFIPYTNVFTKALAGSPLISEHCCPNGDEAEYAKSIFIHANVVNVTKKYVEVDRNLCEVDGITEDCVVDNEPPVNCGAYVKARDNGTLAEGFNCMCLNGPDGPKSHTALTTKIRFDYIVFVGGDFPLHCRARADPL